MFHRGGQRAGPSSRSAPARACGLARAARVMLEGNSGALNQPLAMAAEVAVLADTECLPEMLPAGHRAA